MLEAWGYLSVTVMVLAYALEYRRTFYILIFALACLSSAFYAIAKGSIPFFVAEGIWAVVAFRRWYVIKVINGA